MKTRKLTKLLIATIAGSVIDAMQIKLEAPLKSIRVELSPLLYAALLAKHNLSAAEITAVPTTWLPIVGSISVGVCTGQSKRGYIGIPMPTECTWPIPEFVPRRYDIEIEMVAEADRKRVGDLIAQHDDIRIQSYRLRDWKHVDKVKGIVAAFKTVEDMLSQIPEMAQHVPEQEAVAGIAPSTALVSAAQVRKELML